MIFFWISIVDDCVVPAGNTLVEMHVDGHIGESVSPLVKGAINMFPLHADTADPIHQLAT